MPELLLASTSPRRIHLLEQTGIAFRAISPDFDEVMDDAIPAGELACALAVGKARSVLKDHPDAVVVGGDTLVAFEGRSMSKLDSVDEARSLLRKLSGSACSIYTGFAVVSQDREHSQAVETLAHIKQLEDADIDVYLESGEWKDKAAAVSITIVDKIDGETSAALGLPIRELLPVLAKFGISVAI